MTDEESNSSNNKHPVVILAIVGYRHFKDWQRFVAFVEEWKAEVNEGREPDMIVSGGATGVDRMAERYSREVLQRVAKVFPPDRSKYRVHKNAIYAMRNQQIVDFCTHVLALPSRTGKGTQITIGMAHDATPQRPVFERYVD